MNDESLGEPKSFTGSARVVITGMGVVSALGVGLDTHYPRLLTGKSGIVDRVVEPPDDLPVYAWAPVQGFPSGKIIRNRMLRKLLQPSAAMAVVAAGEAIRDAGTD